MPAVSKQQRKFMGLVHAVQQGKVPASKVSKSARDAAKQMKKSDAEDFASTDEKGLPKKKNEGDLGLTYKKGKTVKVTHKKSGKEIVIVDKPNVRKEYEKIGFFAEGKVDETKQTAMYTQTFDKLLQKQTKGKQPTLKDFDKVFGLMRKRYKELSVQGMTRENKNESVNEADRDYKDEYKKFQSSTKAKKYRAELNKYNRKKGTYGNGDGKDASHKGGKIAGFEAESKNRGRAEKSRLKKENFISTIIDEVIDEYQLNEGQDQMKKIYADLDKKFKKYDDKKIADFNKMDKYLKTKFSKDSGLPDAIASFYNDYRGGENISKNIKRLVSYAKSMKGYKKESVNEAVKPQGIMAKINKIVQDKQAAKISGVLVDKFSAGIMMQIFNAVNDKSKKDMNKGTMRQVQVILHKVMKQNKVRESVNEYSGFKGISSYQQAVIDRQKGSKPKKVSKALKKKQDAWMKKYSNPKGGINQIKLKKDGWPSFPKESVNEANIIQKIDKLAKSNKYGTVDGTRMNGKTAKEIIAIYNHPKMKKFRSKMDKMKSHELMDLTIKLPKMLKIKVESVDEKISKEEWAQYPAYARKLKPYMQKLLKVPLKVRVIKQANHNPWIEIRVAKFGKDVIPNDFRKKALKVIGGSKVRDMDNINYGNIRTNSVSLRYDQWVKLLGNKVKV